MGCGENQSNGLKMIGMNTRSEPPIHVPGSNGPILYKRMHSGMIRLLHNRKNLFIISMFIPCANVINIYVARNNGPFLNAGMTLNSNVGGISS